MPVNEFRLPGTICFVLVLKDYHMENSQVLIRIFNLTIDKQINRLFLIFIVENLVGTVRIVLSTQLKRLDEKYNFCFEFFGPTDTKNWYVLHYKKIYQQFEHQHKLFANKMYVKWNRHQTQLNLGLFLTTTRESMFDAQIFLTQLRLEFITIR